MRQAAVVPPGTPPLLRSTDDLDLTRGGESPLQDPRSSSDNRRLGNAP